MVMEGFREVFVICTMVNVRTTTLRSNSPPAGTNHSDNGCGKSPLQQVAGNGHGVSSLNPGGVRHGSPKSEEVSE
jgi:hypothetical protein